MASSRFSSVNVLWKRGQLYMRNDEKYVSCEVEYKAHTDKAVLVTQNDAEIWIPRSCLTWSSDTSIDNDGRGDILLLHIAHWFAQKNDLEYS